MHWKRFLFSNKYARTAAAATTTTTTTAAAAIQQQEQCRHKPTQTYRNTQPPIMHPPIHSHMYYFSVFFVQMIAEFSGNIIVNQRPVLILCGQQLRLSQFPQIHSLKFSSSVPFLTKCVCVYKKKKKICPVKTNSSIVDLFVRVYMWATVSICIRVSTYAHAFQQIVFDAKLI